ncbi:TPA: hypothetical protein ACGO3F_001306 [Streptococcus suis]
MFLFAFPGMGKTTLAKNWSKVVDLEMSDIKYDNSSVSHLTKEERKSTKRPIKDKQYRQTYVEKAFEWEQAGKIVLVALNFLPRMLWAMWLAGKKNVHIFIPHPSLKEEYRQRYIKRGNNARFIFEVMLIWYVTLLPLYLLSKCLPQLIMVTEAGETLEDYQEQIQTGKMIAKIPFTQTIS